ncbi:hypothetical protein ACDA63_15500 [Uliginosibacterium sp. sgz301328]|uniref:hypothetical protein n=1 Tax=Uliginosibacterium sp. sgz301328 TaxID=3243764 RepID=UPI00359D2E2A
MRTHRFLALLICLSVTPAFAVNLGFMRRTPMTEFSREDTRLFNEALTGVLEDTSFTGTREWGAPGSQAGGSITVVPDPSLKDGCRKLRVANHSRTLRNEGEYVLCKRKGQWELAN